MDLKRQQLDILHKLHPETGAQWAPGHWLAHELKRSYIPNFAADLRALTGAGYLLRDQPYNKISKHSAYARTQKADTLLGERPLRSRAEFKHQILDDMDTMSMQSGIDADPHFRLERFRDLILSGVVPQATLDLIRQKKSLHAIHMKEMDHALYFDGAGPLCIVHEDAHQYTVKEIDRDTEQGRATDKSSKRQTWTWKVRAIKNFVTMRYWKTHYGLDCIFVRVITVNETRKREILDIIKEEIGPCKYIGVAAWKDWGNHEISKGGEESYPQPDGWSFTTPYERVGNAPYQLDKFYEMDR